MSLCMRQISIKINLNIKLYSQLVTKYVPITNRNLSYQTLSEQTTYMLFDDQSDSGHCLRS